MAKRSRRRGGRGARFFTGEPDGLHPGDDIGNRKKRSQSNLPPDDIGNRRKPDEELRLPPDNVGNRVEASPTHEVSGALADIGGRRGRRGGRPRGQGQPVRIGRYIVGGVNPLVAGNTARAMKAHEEFHENKRPRRDDEEGGGRRRRDVDGQAAQGDVSQRRAQRFFNFAEDDRFTYALKSDPGDKRKEAGDAVDNVLKHAGRDAEVIAHIVDDGERPKVLVTIEEKAEEPLFVLGNSALMSLNYLVNKIVNRYPDDRIRLAILPASDEQMYRDMLAEHRAQADPSDAEPEEASPAEEPKPKPKPRPRAKKAAGATKVAKKSGPAERVSIGSFQVPKAGGPKPEEAAEAEPEKATKKKAAKKATKKTTKKATKKVAAKAASTKAAEG
jgi:hypothetical protein